MSMAQQTKRSRPKNEAPKLISIQNQTSTATQTQLLEDSFSFQQPQETDPLKFRIVERRGKHFFMDVRFKGPQVKQEDERAIEDFFEGQSLEGLSPELMTAFLGNLKVLPRLLKLVTDLQQILCE